MALEYRGAEGWNELLPDPAADLVRWRVAVLAAVARRRRPELPLFCRIARADGVCCTR